MARGRRQAGDLVSRPPRRALREDDGVAQVVGAILLFGIFVGIIAFLNVTAVPQAGLAAEEQHLLDVLDELNALQLDAEGAGGPDDVGATVGRALRLSPSHDVGQDFMSFFLAQPARATGEVSFDRDYGAITLHHHAGNARAHWDIGSAAESLPLGRVTFDQNSVFRTSASYHLETGALIADDGGAPRVRFSPPVLVTSDGEDTTVVVKARVLNGTEGSIGGTTTVRLGLVTEAATLVAPDRPNANSTTLRLHTAHGSAWGAYLNETSLDAGLRPWTGGAEVGYHTTVLKGGGKDGLDQVEWRVFGKNANESKRDVRLVSGLAVYTLSMG